MKPTLQLKISQQLTMTPQLQQAIRLLQLSQLELNSEIQELLESNPLLESAEDADNVIEKPAQDSSEAKTEEAATDVHEAMSQEQLNEDLPIDTAWDDIYTSGPSHKSAASGGDDRDFETFNSKAETLQDHLLWQLNLTPFSDEDQVIAQFLIESVDNDGYMRLDLQDVVESLNDEEIGIEEIEAVLHRLQHFDPVGVCARNLQECLLLQLKESQEDPTAVADAQKILEHYMDILGNKDVQQLKRRLKLDSERLNTALRLIQSLDPKPGSKVAPDDTQYIVPDLKVSKHQGRWMVELNAEAAPRIRINADYADLARQASKGADGTFLKNHLQEARWFLKSLQSRNETLLKVATKIMEHQRGFLEYGEEAMKPLVLHEIAEAVEMHESTISRVTTQKYIHTPRGIFELKFFFSSHVNTASGGECSATAIRALIKKLVAAENTAKPLSDNKIALLLKDQGINVARRTIAKYREALRIPPSNERKKLV